ncbi:hypothetical protein HGA13_28665 [Nocardia speluncae]|uniref:Uncharacterized protein n=1 Tax=Nocardia speluncae TaxID=419477 RepID=A0A846XLY2_9NOCA|nr:hypothetical protein [Nocardia speluncae]NKY37012.1 hypothetical protein [Nocardia speluncae]
MWHWTTRTGQYPEAVAFTRRVTEPEPTITEQSPETEPEPEEAEPEAIRRPAPAGGFDLAG